MRNTKRSSIGKPRDILDRTYFIPGLSEKLFLVGLRRCWRIWSSWVV